MKTKLDCYSCFLRIGLQAARMSGANEVQQQCIMQQMLKILESNPINESPLAVAHRIQVAITQETGIADPYRAIKEQCNDEAKRQLPHLKTELAKSNDPLHTALKIAAIGNIMDYGVSSKFDVETLIDRLHHSDFVVNATSTFRSQLDSARTLTYIADNTGEIFFDSLLIEYLLSNYNLSSIKLVIRETPFLNDVADEEHLPVTLREKPSVEILRLSVVPAQRNPAVWNVIKASDIVLCKGMANFENYSEEHDFFFLFIAKCDLVSSTVSEKVQSLVKTGDWIFLKNESFLCA